MIFQKKYLKYKNKLLNIKNILRGGAVEENIRKSIINKKLIPTPEMLASNNNTDYFENFIQYINKKSDIDNLWLIIGAGNKNIESVTDLTRFKDNYDIAITAENKYINFNEPHLIALHIENIPANYLIHSNLKYKFSKIIYDSFTTRLIDDIFNQIHLYCMFSLKIGGILYTDNLRLNNVSILTFRKNPDRTNYSIYDVTNNLLTKQKLNYIHDIRRNILLRIQLDNGSIIPIYNCATLFKKIENDNTISLENILDHIKNYNTYELAQENITKYLHTILNTQKYANFTVEYVNGIYPNNKDSDITDFYKITKLL